MHPYPPWHPDWRWDDVGTLVCPVIFPAVGLLIATIVILRNTAGTTRLKLLSVTVSIALCWPLLPWPVVANARRAAARTLCRNNLTGIAFAVHQYHDKQGRLPSPSVVENEGRATSWRINLLPCFLPDRDDVIQIRNYDHTLEWDDPANLAAARQKMDIYHCPANRAPQDEEQRWYSAYAFLTGPGTAFPGEGPLKLPDIADGTSNTLLVVEACGQNIVWTEPRDIDVSHDAVQINAPGNQPGTSAGIASSYHDRGAQMALADGSVRFFSEKISPDVLQKLTTTAGGESLTDTEF